MCSEVYNKSLSDPYSTCISLDKKDLGRMKEHYEFLTRYRLRHSFTIDKITILSARHMVGSWYRRMGAVRLRKENRIYWRDGTPSVEKLLSQTIHENDAFKNTTEATAGPEDLGLQPESHDSNIKWLQVCTPPPFAVSSVLMRPRLL